EPGEEDRIQESKVRVLMVSIFTVQSLAAALRSPVSSSGDELQLLITSCQNQPGGEELRSYSTLLSTIASRQSRTSFRMAFVEGRDESRIKDVRTGNPGSLFGSISCPIHEILKSTPPTPNIQDTIDRICRVVINESSGGGAW
ncbi:hypothetical protein GOODEAATRI_030934, partial [Goodea atripinnis]